MTLTTETPMAAPPSLPTRPRRRRRRVALVAGVVMVAVLVVGYAAAPQLVWLRSTGSPTFSGSTVVSLPNYGERGTYALNYEHGAEVIIQATVSNEGVLPVTVTDARLTDERRPLVETTSVTAGGSALPFTLGPGESVPLELTGLFGNCRYYHEREAQILAGVLVDGSVLGRGFSRSIELDHELVVRSPMIVACPDRTLTRDDDVRR